MSKRIITRKAAITMGALVGFLKPKLAADAAINFYPILGTLTSRNFAAQKSKIIAGIMKQTEGKLARDARIEDGLGELLDGLEKVETGDTLETEPIAALRAFLEEKGLSDEDIEAACALVDPNSTVGMDDPPPFPGRPNPGGKLDPLDRRTAMDARHYALNALSTVKVDHTSYSSTPSMTETHRTHSKASQGIAMDTAGFAQRFPGLPPLRIA